MNNTHDSKYWWIFALILLLYHLSGAYFVYLFVTQNGGDASRYWFTGEDLSAASWGHYLKPGTDLIRFFTFPWVKYLNLPLWAGFLMFSLLSFPAVWLLFRMLWEAAGEQVVPRVVAVLLIGLPNLHFWTGMVGKEAPVFVAVVLFLFQVFRKRYRSLLLLASLLFLALIRPHVAFILVLSYVISLLITGTLPRRLMLAAVGITAVFTALFTVLLVQLQDFTGGFQRVISKYESHIRVFQKTDAYVPLDEYALPYKFFTFYFRPLPGEREGLHYLISGIENGILLVIAGVALYFFMRTFRSVCRSMMVVFPAVFLLLFGLMYVFAYANFGIIMRTKVMAAPLMYMLLVSLLSAGTSGASASEVQEV